MANNEKKLFIENVNVYLEKADFSYDNIPDGENLIKFNQQISVLECKAESIRIRSEYIVTADKGNAPIIYVSSISIYYLSKDSFGNFSDISEMKDYVEERKVYLVNQAHVGAEMSKLIANISGTYGIHPIIVPPVFKEKES
ncbi:hypothetical protein [Absicoccus intestinalis]|uniref:Preprotein translocase subunit SecB n=1 Tax=Absicoccus intestinalis TaxID=2926319 RepID=A0ABU4WM03_9FIRM|nr:hypothetical protein [Absicoccus sp. CLA-KB-P134]MDX8416444.1 hypothetical protein [Absicoccus sp. CLA-KB-P134]